MSNIIIDDKNNVWDLDKITDQYKYLVIEMSNKGIGSDYLSILHKIYLQAVEKKKREEKILREVITHVVNGIAEISRNINTTINIYEATLRSDQGTNNENL
jgi:hypothetical protein